MENVELRPWSRLGAEAAAKIKSELERIYVEHGELRAAAVVETARDPSSPLHSHFEWDDDVAAERHRLTQAGQLIRSVKISILSSPEKGPRNVRAFVSIEREAGRTYAPILEVISNDVEKAALLRRALADLWAWKKRYGDLSELASLMPEIDEMLHKVKKKTAAR